VWAGRAARDGQTAERRNGIIADDGNDLPEWMRHPTQRVLSHLLERDRQVPEIDNQVRELSRQSSVCRRLEPMPGIGPITATALVATIGEPIREFKNGRQLAAFLGLVPKQHSSGGKERLQGIGKLGLPSAKTIRAIGNSHNQRPDVSSQSLSCFCQALNACTRAASM
jgi:transposase